MQKKETLLVEPSVLRWARESAGISAEYVAGKIKKTEEAISNWESEGSDDLPTYAQLKELTNIYRRSLFVFFLSKPPQEPKVEDELRTRTLENKQIKLDKNIRFLFREAKVNLFNIRDLHQGEKKENGFLKNFSYEHITDAKILAAKAREFISVSINQQKELSGAREALKFWRNKIEEHGFFIFKSKFNDRKNQTKNISIKESQFCGFCIYDYNFPIIYINNGNSLTRQVFTLFHELAHLICRVSGVDVQSRYKPENRTDEQDAKIEKFCNVFAATFLVPDEDFDKITERIGDININDKRFKSLSNTYKVSRQLILIKLRERGIIDYNFYNRQIKIWFDEFEQQKKIQASSKTGGGDWYVTELDKKSKAYAQLAFANYYEDRISDYQLSDYLNVDISNLHKFEEKLWK